MKKQTILILLFSIIVTGLVLRIVGLKWGLTTTKYFHFATYAPDESETIKAIASLNPRKLDFKIDSFLVARGTLQIYLTAAWIKFASIFNLVKIYPSFDYYKSHPGELVMLYITARSLSVFFEILTIIILFFMGKIFYGDYKIGLLASFLVAITPIHVIWSHYIGTDTIFVFQTCLILLLSFYILKNCNYKIYLAAGFIMGLTGATKSSSLPLVLIPILAHILGKNKIFDRRLLFYLFFILVGFITGNPYSIIEPTEFILRLKRTLIDDNVSFNPALKLYDCLGPQPNLIYYLTMGPKYAFGIPLSVLFLLGFIFAFIKRKKVDILILVWIIIFWLLISLSSPWRVLRWQLPYVPFLCLLSAGFISSILQYTHKYLRIFIITTVFFVSCYTLFYSTAYVKMMTEKDVRDEASEWIENNIPEGKKIGVPNVYFWNPSIVMMEFWYKETEPFYKGIKKYKISQLLWDIEILKKENPDYVILTDFEYHPILKLKDQYPHPEVMPFLERIMQSKYYVLLKKFEKKPELFGIVSINSFLPVELRMVNPTILVYKKSK